MVTKQFYAIYDIDRKSFKGRGNMSGANWTEWPTQTYDTESRAKSALKAHLRVFNSYPPNRQIVRNIIVIPVAVSWEEPR